MRFTTPTLTRAQIHALRWQIQSGNRAPDCQTPIGRFFQYVEQDVNGCWNWRGPRSWGYGLLYMEGRRYRAHRVAYEWMIGTIHPDLVADHLCRNRACVNPSHIEIVTQRTNVLRGDGLLARSYRAGTCYQGHPWTVDSTLYGGRGRRCAICLSHWRQKRTGLGSAFESGVNEWLVR